MVYNEIKIFLKFSSPRNIILICPKLKILKHINKEIDSCLVVVEYIPFPRNIILICPKFKILKHINKEIDSCLVVVEYIPFLSNLLK